MLHERTKYLVVWIALVLVAAVIVAAVLLLHVRSGYIANPVPALKKGTASINWSIFRGNQNLSAAADGVLADEFELAWTFATGGKIESTPIINNGTVFITSSDGKIYALGQGSGSKIWEFNSGAPVEASALYFENTVYAGNHDGALYAIDAETGKEKWKYTAESKITASANYAKISGSRTLILVGSFDNFMHAVDAETGKLVWKYATKSYINGTPAVDKGILAFGGCDSFLRILDANEGNETACFKMGSYIASSVCFFGDDIYLAHYGGNVVCVSLQQSKILWQYPKDSSLEAFQGSPAVNSEKVVVGCQDFNVYSLNRFTGELLWTFETKGPVNSSPVIFGNKVVTGSSDGRLYILNLDDGAKLWSYETGGEVSGFAVTGGMIIAGVGDARVYAFKQSSRRTTDYPPSP